MAYKYNLEGNKVGKLLVGKMVPVNKRPSQNHGNYWYCICDCGNEVMVPTAYLTGNGNFTQKSCGCDKKIKSFLASSKMNLTEDYLNSFTDFDKFLFLHKQLTAVSGKNVTEYNLDNYKKDIEYFYSQEQFNKIYQFWLKHPKENTFYDWAKPSLDHIIPKSRGGSNDIKNLQFLTVFENLAKRDMTWEEWNNFKRQTNTKSDYFIETIMKQEVDNEKI